VIAWTPVARAGLPAEGYADLVEKVSPAVVFISSTRKQPDRAPGRGDSPSPFPPGSPFGEFFKHFQDRMPRQRGPVTAMGSGFIVSPEGDIVTNNHVIDGASRVEVKLSDGRKFAATVVGADPKTDLALLRIKADRALPHVTFGDSDTLRRGHVVLAVGNPFGLGGTVTAGIVSAHHRNINAGPYDNFIQTDAAINQGNSGGPLFNTKGEVVGVNTAIFSPNGGSVGIGFAIPSNLTKDVVGQLREHGRVERGWLGVTIQPLSPEIAQAMSLDGAHGALVSDITPDSPAAKAGLRPGDVIVGYDGKAVKEMRDLPRLVAATEAGRTVPVELWRDGRKMAVSVAIAKLAADRTAAAGTGDAPSGGMASEKLGARLAMLDRDAKSRLDLSDDAAGVVVTGVDPDGRAAAAGLRPGDVIVRVGARTVKTPSDVAAAIDGSRSATVLLLVNRGGGNLFVGVRLAET
jgi:serine protease Do